MGMNGDEKLVPSRKKEVPSRKKVLWAGEGPTPSSDWCASFFSHLVSRPELYNITRTRPSKSNAYLGAALHPRNIEFRTLIAVYPSVSAFVQLGQPAADAATRDASKSIEPECLE